MNPSDDPLADELWAPTGNIPLSKFDEYLKKNQGNQPPKKPEEEEEEKEPENKLKLIELKN